MLNTGLKRFFFLLLILDVLFLFGLVRQAHARDQIDQFWMQPPAPVADIGSTNRLEILPLYDKAGYGSTYITGHGVSYLIRTDHAAILLDVGDNPENAVEAPFLTNMRALGVDWDEIDSIFISHPHPDHTGGLRAWSQGRVMLDSQPPELPAKLVYAPANLKGKNLVFASDEQPFVIAPGVATTGVLPYEESFPFMLTQPRSGEQALVINVAGRGLVLITGCGHPGMDRLVARAEAVYGLPVIGLVGGLHYNNYTAEDAQAPINYLAAREPQLVALSPHDSTPAAIEAFRATFADAYQEIAVGRPIVFPRP